MISFDLSLSRSYLNKALELFNTAMVTPTYYGTPSTPCEYQRDAADSSRRLPVLFTFCTLGQFGVTERPLPLLSDADLTMSPTGPVSSIVRRVAASKTSAAAHASIPLPGSLPRSQNDNRRHHHHCARLLDHLRGHHHPADEQRCVRSPPDTCSLFLHAHPVILHPLQSTRRSSKVLIAGRRSCCVPRASRRTRPRRRSPAWRIVRCFRPALI
jgi:hypothetical protein